ncbi:hypothetical protein BBP40_001201 [Aspergillus hancockii]|nr:hypothetical protein BBP40_001201 [Aspergillus hancockii]
MGTASSQVITGNASDKGPLLKVLLVGAEKVGKTSLIIRFTENSFNTSVPSTIGDVFKIRVLLGGQYYRLATWDSAGNERYWYLVPPFARDTHVIVAVYDVTSRQSLQEVLHKVDRLAEQASVRAAVFLVGNKSDLESRREVTSPAAEEVAKSRGYEFIETSALSGKGVRRLFEMVGEVGAEGEKPCNRRQKGCY